MFSKNGADVVAVDITKKAISMAKKNAKLQKIDLKAYNQDAENLQFKDETFDYVFSWGVLHHSKNTLKAFEEVSRVLKKGGRGLIMVYNKNSLRYYINGLNWLIFKGKIFQGYNLEKVQDFYTDGYYHKHFTSSELKKSIEQFGLKVERISITHMNTNLFYGLSKNIEQWLKDNFGWLLVAEFKKY